MPTEIKAIQCPKCGGTQKVEIKPGDFRCDNCGTEYFIDDGTVKFGQATPRTAAEPVKATRSGSVVLFISVGLIVGIVILIGVFSSSTTSRTSTSQNPAYNWYADANALYLSADKKPVLVTVGTKTFWGNSGKNADYIEFNDMRDGSVLGLLPLADGASVIPDRTGRTEVRVEEFANGDIFFIVEKAQLFRVRKTSYTVTDVTRSLFEGQPELASGVAKIEFIPSYEGEAFMLITNEGKQYYYYPATRELRTETVKTGRPYYAGARLAGAEEKTAFGFSTPWDYDHPDIPGQLIAYRYKVDPYAHEIAKLTHSYPSKWDDPDQLKYSGVVSQHDFTPGRVYFDYGVLYFDTEYVLISYRLTPGKTAPRFVQLLNAQTAAIVFTTRFDVLYANQPCIRYSDGFAIADTSRMFTLSLSGKLEKHIPEMYRGDAK